MRKRGLSISNSRISWDVCPLGFVGGRVVVAGLVEVLLDDEAGGEDGGQGQGGDVVAVGPGAAVRVARILLS
jgi:hypothetical protein